MRFGLYLDVREASVLPHQKESLLKLFWEKELYWGENRFKISISIGNWHSGEVTSEEIFVTETTIFQHKIFL